MRRGSSIGLPLLYDGGDDIIIVEVIHILKKYDLGKQR